MPCAVRPGGGLDGSNFEGKYLGLTGWRGCRRLLGQGSGSNKNYDEERE
jgi:hypothetical protein